MRRIHFDATDSTQVQARRLAAEHPGETLLVTAAEQTAGRGRQGRTWQSPRGGAWLSFVWPLRRSARAYAGASLATAVAVRRAVASLASQFADRLLIKWPNDLLLDECKVAGILCEQVSLGSASPEGTGALLVGVGVNVDFDPAAFDGDLRTPATTLAAAGARATVDAVVEAVGDELAWAMRTFETDGLNGSMLAELRAHLAFVGTVRTWAAPTGPVRGRILGVDDDGRLLLEGPSGTLACETGELA
jgi:BirA family biotin operon repressor/biotin-[acetyl-CoA-carboxylase] ligase